MALCSRPPHNHALMDGGDGATQRRVDPPAPAEPITIPQPVARPCAMEAPLSHHIEGDRPPPRLPFVAKFKGKRHPRETSAASRSAQSSRSCTRPTFSYMKNP